MFFLFVLSFRDVCSPRKLSVDHVVLLLVLFLRRAAVSSHHRTSADRLTTALPRAVSGTQHNLTDRSWRSPTFVEAYSRVVDEQVDHLHVSLGHGPPERGLTPAKNERQPRVSVSRQQDTHYPARLDTKEIVKRHDRTRHLGCHPTSAGFISQTVNSSRASRQQRLMSPRDLSLKHQESRWFLCRYSAPAIRLLAGYEVGRVENSRVRSSGSCCSHNSPPRSSHGQR